MFAISLGTLRFFFLSVYCSLAKNHVQALSLKKNRDEKGHNRTAFAVLKNLLSPCYKNNCRFWHDIASTRALCPK